MVGRSVKTPDWFDDALCRGVGPDYFFPEGFDARAPGEQRRINEMYEIGKQMCNRCPVKEQCLKYGMEQDTASYGYGLWGGLSAHERYKLAMSNRYVRQCGCGAMFLTSDLSYRGNCRSDCAAGRVA